MEVKAITRYARIAPAKARDFARHIRGLPVEAALDMLAFSSQKGAHLLRKTLASAVANAENNNGLNRAILFVKEAAIDQGPALKRFQPAARGSAAPLKKRMSHIKVIVAEREEDPESAQKPARKSRATRKPASGN
ncbi:MAG: 50S ribosomal protein L22 [Verrucomicrobiia bacterium]